MFLVLCAKCRIPTNHKVIYSVDEYLDWDQHFSSNESFQVVQCQGCNSYCFRHAATDSESGQQIGPDEWDDGAIVRIFPERHRNAPALPDANFLPYKVRIIYEETHRALNHDQPILAGIGIRALVEAVCHDRNANGTLASMIDQLVTTNDLKQTEADILHKLRFMGNNAAHEIKAPSEESLSLAFDIVEHLLVGVYLLERRAKSLPDR